MIRKNVFIGLKLNDNNFSALNTPSLSGVASGHTLDKLLSLALSDDKLYLSVVMRTTKGAEKKFYAAMFRRDGCVSSNCQVCTKVRKDIHNVPLGYYGESCIHCKPGYRANLEGTACQPDSSPCNTMSPPAVKIGDICSQCTPECF